MKISTYIFKPDDHYAYPELELNTNLREPYSMGELLEFYEQAGYTAITMGDLEEGPEGNMELFMRYSYNNYYENLFIAVYEDEVNESDINQIVSEANTLNFDEFSWREDLMAAFDAFSPEDNPWINGEVAKGFIKEVLKNPSIILFGSIGKLNEFVLNKEYSDTSNPNYVSNPLDFVIDKIIVDEFRNGDKSKAAKLYRSFSSFENYPELNDIVASKLSPEEYKNLKSLEGGYNILGRFKR
jgi:hypothetical protein